MHEECRPCGRPSRHFTSVPYLRREPAHERGPVAQRCPGSRATTRTTARAEQVVAGAAHEERAAPVDVVARPRAGDPTPDPDRAAVHCCGAVVAPAGARRVADLGLVAGEAIVRARASAARD